MNWIYENRWLMGSLFVLFLLSLVPLFQVLVAGFSWRDVTCGDNYYCARMHKIADGYPLAGNPDFFEHRNDIPPAFVAPDMVSAAPMVLGLPLPATVIFNDVLWSLIFGLLLFMILRRLGLSSPWSTIATILIYLEVYFQVMHPVSMQLVQPAFLFFILMFLRWWDDPKAKYANVLLALGIAAPFYAYQYLYQLAIVFLGLVFLYIILKKDWSRLKQYVVAAIYTFILILPVIIFTFLQIRNPYYLETMLRVGLAYTHLPSGEAFISLARMMPIAIGILLVSRWILHDARNKVFLLFLLLLGVAIEIVSVANVLTGLDLETASHLARFVQLWVPLATVVVLFFLWRDREFALLTFPHKLAIGSLVLISIAAMLMYTPNPREFLPGEEKTATLKDRKALTSAFTWFDNTAKDPKVIWVEPHSNLAILIPIYTKHYLLFAATGMLNLMPSAESEVRYLAASALSNPTEEKIAGDVWHYAGAGFAEDTPNTINRWVKYCRLLHLDRAGYACGELTDSKHLYASLYKEMYERYVGDVQPNLSEELLKYHVAYIVKDELHDTDFHPEALPNAIRVYADGRVSVYQLTD